jgi:tRNA(fMet)-specific endonuclease VapC
VLVDTERKGVGALDGLVNDDDDAAIAAVTVAELVVGAELADGKRRAAREAFLAEVLEAVSVEDYDLDVALEHGALLAHTRRSGRPRGAHDLIIAATARARRREVVSTDLDGFAELPEVTLRRV